MSVTISQIAQQIEQMRRHNETATTIWDDGKYRDITPFERAKAERLLRRERERQEAAALAESLAVRLQLAEAKTREQSLADLASSMKMQQAERWARELERDQLVAARRRADATARIMAIAAAGVR